MAAEKHRRTFISYSRVNKEFSYYVNGNLVYVLNVDDRQKVKIGFIVETIDEVTRVHIHFNWLTLYPSSACMNWAAYPEGYTGSG